MICGEKADVGTCQGDTGGPLIANINEKFNQIIQANAFRSLADVSFTGFYKFEALTTQKINFQIFLFLRQPQLFLRETQMM